MAKPEQTIKDFDPAILEAFHEYVHGGMSRRGFLDQAAKYAVGGMTAAGILESLLPKYAQAQEIRDEDPRIVSELSFTSELAGICGTPGRQRESAFAGGTGHTRKSWAQPLC